MEAAATWILTQYGGIFIGLAWLSLLGALHNWGFLPEATKGIFQIRVRILVKSELHCLHPANSLMILAQKAN